jgi:hypothetical protein
MLEGSAKGDGVYEILRGLRGNWRYFPSLRQIGIGQSRDKAAKTWVIESAAKALRAAGHEVTVEVDEGESRSFAEQEAERNDRAEERADRQATYADNAASRSAAAFAGVQRISDGIPFGQPILVGHHSEGRARADIRRMDNGMRKGVDESRKADYHAGRAESAEHYQQHRENVPATLRRIAKLEAEQRQLGRRLNGTGLEMHGEDTPASGAYAVRLTTRLAEIADELTYWREHVAKAEAGGVKIWSRDDFAKGDFAQARGSGRLYQVERVNQKSLTVPSGTNLHMLPVVTRGAVVHAMGPSQWTVKLTYDEVSGRKSAAEVAVIVAEVDRRLAEKAAS